MTSVAHIGIVADSDAYFRLAMSVILTRQFGFSELIEVESLDEALECLGERPGIRAALLDLSMPGMKTSANLRAVRECSPETRLAVTSSSKDRRDILLALEAGAHGFLPKSLSVPDLTSAMQAVLGGHIYVPPLIAEIPAPIEGEGLAGSRPIQASKTNASGPLTSRQQDVLDLLIQGKTNKEIACALKLGEGTIKIHMAALFRYFGVSNRAAAAVAGARPYPNRRPSPFKD